MKLLSDYSVLIARSYVLKLDDTSSQQPNLKMNKTMIANTHHPMPPSNNISFLLRNCLFLLGTVSLLVLAPTVSTVQAQENEAAPVQASGKQYTLGECLQIAFKNNIEVLRSENEIDRFAAFKQSAFGDFLPSVAIGMGWTRYDRDQIRFVNDELIVSRNDFNYNVQAGLTVFDGLRNIKNADKSAVDFEAAQKSYKRKKEDIVYAVQWNFYNLLRLKQFVRINESNLDRSQKQLDRINEMNRVGAVPQADVYRQQVTVSNDELSLLEAGNNYENAVLDFQALIGMNPVAGFEVAPGNVSVDVSRDKMAQYSSSLPDVNTMVLSALKERADMQVAALNVESAEYGIGIASAGHWPRLTAYATYGWNNIEFNRFSALDRFFYGLNLSFPIFSNFNVSTAVERTEVDLKNTTNVFTNLKRTVTTDIHKALNNLKTAEKNAEIAEKKLISSKEDLRTASERYNLGAGTLLDQIVANANLTLAEADIINAAFNYITARRQLEYELGKVEY